MNNTIEPVYYESQEADINFRNIFKMLASTVASIGVTVACNAITNSFITAETKSAKFDIPGGDIKVLYRLVDTKHDEDGVYYNMDFNVTVFRKNS